MRRYLMIAVLFLCFCNGSAFADDAQTNIIIQDNHGYIYGTAPKMDDETATTTTWQPSPIQGGPGPIACIINVVKKIDAWVQRNLW